MKKLLLIIICLTSTMLFCSCDKLMNLKNNSTGSNSDIPFNSVQTPANSLDSKTSIPEDTLNQPTSNYKIKDYYPFLQNAKYIFEGKGMEYAAYTAWIDYLKEDRVQIRLNNGGTEIVRVYENKSGELRNIYTSKEEAYFREDYTTRQPEKNEILLKEPLVKGTSWTLEDGRKRYISNSGVQVSTPSGTYAALEVTTDGKDSTIVDYYGLNTGLVKTVFSSKGSQIVSTLSKIEKNSPLVQSIKFYYPNANLDKLYFVKKTISFNTNDITKMVFEKNFKDTSRKEFAKILGPNTKIKSLYLNKDNMVYVDFSKELVSEMNSGSGPEQLIIQSIVNTLGDYYGASKVYITVEGEPYSSGHIVMKKGEAFTVNKKNSAELK